MSWNKNIKEKILDKYNLVLHPLKNKKIFFDGVECTILNVFKRWSSGWYLSLEIDLNKNEYVEIPFKNINSEDNDIIERINCVQDRTKILGDK